MKEMHDNNRILPVSAVIRRLLLAWLVSTTVEYFLLPTAFQNLNELAGIAQISPLRFAIITVICFILLNVWNRIKWERWLMAGTFALLALISLLTSFTLPFLIVNLLILSCLIIYAVYGWNGTIFAAKNKVEQSAWSWVVWILALLFIVFVSTWTVCRVYSFSTPTYDFGIFSQMFHNMKTTGLPLTTVERDGLLSHFHVHVSPIYYLLLPFYCLFPSPDTLQVLQAIVLASAVIPLWKLGKHHSLTPSVRALLCALLLLYPAYAGGTSYDIHENAFLTPCLLWLFYGMDRKSIPVSVVSAILVLSIKEDAAVYLAVAALYYMLHGLLYKDRWEITAGFVFIIAACTWFVAVTDFLSEVGDGVMTYRYKNFNYDGSGALTAVVMSVFLCPMKAVFECVDSEKLSFIAYTILPLAALPLFTRRYERYILLIPYVLINLMSDYQYQHDIFFQYAFGSTACLLYLTAVNLADIKTDFLRFIAVAAALCISFVCFMGAVVPKAISYPKRCIQNAERYEQIRQTLSLIPDDATVSASTFYTTHLSQRPILYDVRYGSLEHILSTEYVVLPTQDDTYDELAIVLTENGYSVYAQLENVIIIYKK